MADGKKSKAKGRAKSEAKAEPRAKAKAKGQVKARAERGRGEAKVAPANRPTMTCELGGDRPRPPGPTWRDADPRAAAPRLGARMQEVDPGYTYDVRTFSAGSWIKVGEVWHDASAGNKEYWGMDSFWFDKILDLWMYPIGSNSYYASYTAFKTSINSQFPSNTKFYITKTIV